MSQWCNQDFFQDPDQDRDLNFKTKTKTLKFFQDQDQDLFVMYTRDRLKSLEDYITVNYYSDNNSSTAIQDSFQ